MGLNEFVIGKVRNPYWKNPYQNKVTYLIWLWLVINFLFIGLLIYLFPDGNLYVLFNIIFWFAGLKYIKHFHKNKYLRWFSDNKDSKFITKDELIQLERERKLKRILK
jgi:hypothetical protein